MCLFSSTVLEASRILASAGAEAFRTAGEADRGGRAFNVHYDGEEGAPVFYAILVAAHLYFSRCASERERSERARCASSRVPFAISRSGAHCAQCFGKSVEKARVLVHF